MKKLLITSAFLFLGFASKAQVKISTLADTTVKVIALVRNDTLFIKTDLDTFILEWNKQKQPLLPPFKKIVNDYQPIFYISDYRPNLVTPTKKK